MKYIIDSTALTDIANAIRKKRGTSSPIRVADMASEILLISGGGTRPIVPQNGTWQLKSTTDKKYVILGTDDDVAGNPKYFRLLRTYGFPYTMNMEYERINSYLGSDVDDTLFTSADAPSLFPQSITTKELAEYVHSSGLGEVAQHGASSNRLWDSTKITDDLWNTWYSDYVSKGGYKNLADFKQAVIEGCANSDTSQGAIYVAESRTNLENELGFFIDTVGIWGGNPSCKIDGIEIVLDGANWGSYNWRENNYIACSSMLSAYVDNKNTYDIHRDSSNLSALSVINRMSVGKVVELFIHNTLGTDWTRLRSDLDSLKSLVDNGEVEVVTRKQYAELGEYVDNPITKINVSRIGNEINVGETDDISLYTVIATFADGTTLNVTDEAIIKLADTSEPALLHIPAYYKGFTDDVIVEVVAGQSNILVPFIIEKTKLNTTDGHLQIGNTSKVYRYDVTGLEEIYIESSHNHQYLVGFSESALSEYNSELSIFSKPYYSPTKNPNIEKVPEGMNYFYVNSAENNGYDIYPWVISKSPN